MVHRGSVIPVLVAATNLAGGPGFAQALIGRRRIAAAWLASFLLAWAASTVTVWALGLALVILLGSVIDAYVRARRQPPPFRWHGISAGVCLATLIAGVIAVRACAVEAFRIPASSMWPTLEIGDHILVDKLSSRWRAPARGELIVFRHPCQPRATYVKRVVAVARDTVELRCGVLYVNGAAAPRKLVDASYTNRDLDEATGEHVEVGAQRYRETLDGRMYDILDDEDMARQLGFPLWAPSCDAPGREDHPASPHTIVEHASLGDPCAPHRHLVVPDDAVFVLGDHRYNSSDSRIWGAVPLDHVVGHVVGRWWPLGRFGSL
jgi:signal peptidase I